MRVKVWSGDGKKYLGEGDYNDDVPVYFIIDDNCSLLSSPCAEKKPKGITRNKIHTSKHNPKIILDTGEIVYGCQVWWEKI